MPRIIKENTDKKHLAFTRQKLAVIVLVVVVTAAFVGLGIWWYTSIRREDTGQATTSEQDDPQYIRNVVRLESADEAAAALVPEAQRAADAGDVATVERIYTEAIAEYEGNTNVQTNLYIVMAQYMVTLGQDEKALAAAQKAHEIDTEQLYQRTLLPLIGYTAYRLDQKELALEYIRKTYEQQQTDPYLEAGVLRETEDFLEQLEAEQ